MWKHFLTLAKHFDGVWVYDNLGKLKIQKKILEFGCPAWNSNFEPTLIKIDEFRPTNIILDYEHGNKPVKLNKKNGYSKSFLLREESALGYLTIALVNEDVFICTKPKALQLRGFQIGQTKYVCWIEV